MLFLEGHLLFSTGPTGKKTCFYPHYQVKYSICEVLEKLDDVESWQSHVNKYDRTSLLIPILMSTFNH